MNFDRKYIEKKTTLSKSRSSGPGGQNVNKVETKVEGKLSIESLDVLSDSEKQIIRKKLANRIIDGDYLHIYSQIHRSQSKNKEEVIVKIVKILTNALKKDPDRIPTKPTQESMEKRVISKRMDGEKKSLRGNLKNRIIE
jgi:ribosome-associated protein